MLPRILFVFLSVWTLADGVELSSGMSLEDVRIERGRPESRMTLGDKEVWIYADGTRFEFVDGKLVKENELALSAAKAEPVKASFKEDPLIRAEDIIRPREEKTISASIQNHVEPDFSNMGEGYVKHPSLQGLEDAIDSENKASLSNDRRIWQQRLVIAFAVEWLASVLVLGIAFQVSGFPSIFRQILLLSLTVALVSSGLDLLLGANPLNPIRSVIGFGLLLILIRQFTDVREWATAIKIALIARLISMGLIWAVMLGLSMLFSL